MLISSNILRAAVYISLHPYNKNLYDVADIDACMGGHDCSQICFNTIGSYYCDCMRGYYMVDDTECRGEVVKVMFLKYNTFIF